MRKYEMDMDWIERLLTAVADWRSTEKERAEARDFPRMYNSRPGYGYAEYGDKLYHHNHSTKDGVFQIDMENGKKRAQYWKEACYA